MINAPSSEDGVVRCLFLCIMNTFEFKRGSKATLQWKN